MESGRSSLKIIPQPGSDPFETHDLRPQGCGCGRLRFRKQSAEGGDFLSLQGHFVAGVLSLDDDFAPLVQGDFDERIAVGDGRLQGCLGVAQKKAQPPEIDMRPERGAEGETIGGGTQRPEFPGLTRAGEEVGLPPQCAGIAGEAQRSQVAVFRQVFMGFAEMRRVTAAGGEALEAVLVDEGAIVDRQRDVVVEGVPKQFERRQFRLEDRHFFAVDEGVAAIGESTVIVRGEPQLVQVEVVDAAVGHLGGLALEQRQLFRDGRNFDGDVGDDADGERGFFQVIAGGADIEADFVETGVAQPLQIVAGDQGAVGVEPEVEAGAESLADGGDEFQCLLQGQQRLAAADADTAETEFRQVVDVIAALGKTQGIGGRLVDAGLRRRAVKAAAVAEAVDEQTGPASLAAKATAGG